MIVLIEPSSLTGIEPDTIYINNVISLSLGKGAARVTILKGYQPCAYASG